MIKKIIKYLIVYPIFAVIYTIGLCIVLTTTSFSLLADWVNNRKI